MWIFFLVFFEKCIITFLPITCDLYDEAYIVKRIELLHLGYLYYVDRMNEYTPRKMIFQDFTIYKDSIIIGVIGFSEVHISSL